LTVLHDFFFAGTIADIPTELRSISSQLLIVRAQLPPILLDFLSRCAHVFEILSDLGLVMMAPVAMTNIPPEVVSILSPVMSLPPPVIAVSSPVAVLSPVTALAAAVMAMPSPVILPFLVVVVAAVLMITAAVPGIGCRG
jgi:hypothetical protein